MSPFRLVFNTERDGQQRENKKRGQPANDGCLGWRPYWPPLDPFSQIFFYFTKKGYACSKYFLLLFFGSPPSPPFFSLGMSLLLTTAYIDTYRLVVCPPSYSSRISWPNVPSSSATVAIISAQANSLVWEFVWPVLFFFLILFSSGGHVRQIPVGDLTG
jgi:hypothetical protein